MYPTRSFVISDFLLTFALMSVLNIIVEQLKATSPIEWIAVVCGLLYVILIAKKHLAAWFFAIVGSGCSMYLCYFSQYYLETFLQFFYVIMGVWGWISWKRPASNQQPGTSLRIVRWSWKAHLLNASLSTLLTLVLGYYFDTYTDQARPYLDAFTTVFSLAATFMVTQKVLENWLYWIVIDFVSIELYAYRELYLLSALMCFYTALAVYGYFQWRKAASSNQLSSETVS